MKEKRREKGAGDGEKAAVGIEGKGRVLEAPRNRSPNAHPCIPSPTPPVVPRGQSQPPTMFSGGVPSPSQPRRGVREPATDTPHGQKVPFLPPSSLLLEERQGD